MAQPTAPALALQSGVLRTKTTLTNVLTWQIVGRSHLGSRYNPCANSQPAIAPTLPTPAPKAQEATHPSPAVRQGPRRTPRPTSKRPPTHGPTIARPPAHAMQRRARGLLLSRRRGGGPCGSPNGAVPRGASGARLERVGLELEWGAGARAVIGIGWAGPTPGPGGGWALSGEGLAGWLGPYSTTTKPPQTLTPPTARQFASPPRSFHHQHPAASPPAQLSPPASLSLARSVCAQL